MNTDKLLRFRANDTDFLFSGHTGLVLRADDELERALRAARDELDADLATCLFGKGAGAGEAALPPPERTPLQNLTLFVTDACNLACSYCYVRQNGVDRPAAMSLDTLKAALDRFLARFDPDRAKKTPVNLFFFGGEPLLNLPFMRGAVDHVRAVGEREGLKFTFSVVTNGTVLDDDALEFLVANNVAVMISIDGPADVHDRSRPFKNGKGSSHAAVVKNAARLAEYMKVAARVTLTDLDTDLVQLYEDLVAVGFSEVSVTPVSDAEQGADVEAACGVLRRRIGEMERHILENVRRRRWVKFGNIVKHVKRLHFGSRSQANAHPYPCTAGYSSFAVATNGDVYVCHRFNNVAEMQLGSVAEGVDWERREAFLENHRLSSRLAACSACWAAAMCGGTCYHTSYVMDRPTREVSKLHCTYTQETILSALRIYTSMSDEERCVVDNLA